MNMKLRMGSCMTVCGPTKSGKTVFIMKLLDRAKELFDVPPVAVYWFYGHRTKMHDQLAKKNYNMIQGIPKDFSFVEPNSIVMMDDLMVASSKNKQVTDLFCV